MNSRMNKPRAKSLKILVSDAETGEVEYEISIPRFEPEPGEIFEIRPIEEEDNSIPWDAVCCGARSPRVVAVQITVPHPLKDARGCYLFVKDLTKGSST